MTPAHDLKGRNAGRLLLVSYWFPPFTAVASIRMGKFAKHMLEHGWDVRVLSAANTSPATMPLEIPKELVIHTPWSDVNRRVEDALAPFLSRFRPPPPLAEGEPEPPRKTTPFRALLRRIYHELVLWPDNKIGWRDHALEAGGRLVHAWRPDVIYASSPPMSSFVVADALARRHRIPWIGEFRDLWIDDPRYEYSALRAWFERRWEDRILKRAAAIGSVSPRWQDRLSKRFGRPTFVAMNGCVVSDFPEVPPVEPQKSGPLRIVYTGHIYESYRDPSPLFQAIAKLRLQPSDVLVEFVGTELHSVKPIAARLGVLENVIVHPPVSYRKALQIQLYADVLLHLQWCDPKEDGTIASKIFDYLCARRPILGIALESSVAAEIVAKYRGGLVTNDVDKVASQLGAWIEEKKRGGISPLPAEASQGLERTLQFETIRAVVTSVVSSGVARSKTGPALALAES